MDSLPPKDSTTSEPGQGSGPEVGAHWEQVVFDRPAPHVGRITMNRPNAANAQGVQMTYELNEAFDYCARSGDIHVIILAGAGRNFNGGHDLNPDTRPVGWHPAISTWSDYSGQGYEKLLTHEKEIYWNMCERWRNLPKPTIAMVQGAVVAGGTMLAWACDLIIAADNARFRDVVVGMGVSGIEWWQAPHEMGVRKAKEWLWTGDWITAEQGRELGMINQVVPLDELEVYTLDMAGRIAAKPQFAVRMVKEAANYAQDQMGRRSSSQFGFYTHQLCHAHNAMRYGVIVDPRNSPAKDPEGMRKAMEKWELGVAPKPETWGD